MRLAVNAWFWDSPTTGSGQYTRRLVEHLAVAVSDLGLDLQIVLIAPESEISDPESPIPNIRFRLTADRRRLLADLGKVWFEQVAFPRACARLGADIAHVPYWASPLRSSVATVTTIHDLIPLLLREYSGGPLVRLYTALVSATARSAPLVLTDSETSRCDILTRLDLPPARVRTIPLAADACYRPLPDANDGASRAQYDLPDRYVLYLGGFDVRKNVATALRTYRWVGPAIGGECPLVVAGRLPERHAALTPDPRRLVREQGVDERTVRFIGFVDEADKPALYRGAVAFLFPSRYEGFGLPPLEALACGTPVVGSDAASLPEVVGDAGVLLSPDDAEGMAGALIQLAADEGFRAEMKHRAAVQAARFSWERTARETFAAYGDVIGER